MSGLILGSGVHAAAAHTITLAPPAATRTEGFHLGTATAPDGSTLTVDSRSLILNGHRWTPAMGEFHFSRYPADEWAGELKKMKAGGIDIVATYVFWIHHEEVRDQWDWRGQRDLRRFIQTAAEAGLKVIVRLGPWCHGEVRDGGIPDWVLESGVKVRSDDPAYLALVKPLYAQIAAQTEGLLWKDGGPVVGVQLENEYRGPAEHLLTLKHLARDAGFDVPLYTRTGWPELSTPMPFGEILPLYGVYAEGFWDRELTSMPGRYWSGFHFSTLRVDANIANEALGRRDAQDPPDIADYPYLTCEIGGGMMSSYHRRIRMEPADVLATTLVKLGSGSVSPGYYMYHGGTNPDSATGITLMEEQATAMTNWNDMPVKNYDFQAPLGQYGQIRPHYYGLRDLHRFLATVGDRIAEMDTALPDERPAGAEDHETLRWAVRSDGHSGFVFINNYERGATLPDHAGVQFTLARPDGLAPVTFPTRPVDLPSGAQAIWPFELDLGHGVTLAWATAMPVGVQTFDEGVVQWTFARTLPAEADTDVAIRRGDRVSLHHLNQDVTAVEVMADDGTLIRLRLRAPTTITPASSTALAVASVRSAAPAREISLSAVQAQAVATAPADDDFAQAAEWIIGLPPGFDAAQPHALLRLDYVGDVARFYIGDTFITDDYYNGRPLEIGLARHADLIATGAPLRVLILPLRRDAVQGDQPKIFFSDPSAVPDFAGAEAIAQLNIVDLDASL